MRSSVPIILSARPLELLWSGSVSLDLTPMDVRYRCEDLYAISKLSECKKYTRVGSSLCQLLAKDRYSSFHCFSIPRMVLSSLFLIVYVTESRVLCSTNTQAIVAWSPIAGVSFLPVTSTDHDCPFLVASLLKCLWEVILWDFPIMQESQTVLMSSCLSLRTGKPREIYRGFLDISRRRRLLGWPSL